MKTGLIKQLMACHRPGQSDPGGAKIAKAYKAANSDPALKSVLEAQIAFDTEILGNLEAITAPPALLDQIASFERPQPKRIGLTALKQPAVLSVGFAVLVVIGMLLYFTVEKMNRFVGQEQVVGLLETVEQMSGVELEPKVSQLGSLGDWLFSKYAFENYQIPPEFAAYKTMGCRVFKQNGARVAQIAVETDELIFFIFPPKEFGVKLRPRNGWRSFEQGDWAGAVRVYEGVCVMIAKRGDQQDIKEILAKIPKKK